MRVILTNVRNRFNAWEVIIITQLLKWYFHSSQFIIFVSVEVLRLLSLSHLKIQLVINLKTQLLVKTEWISICRLGSCGGHSPTTAMLPLSLSNTCQLYTIGRVPRYIRDHTSRRWVCVNAWTLLFPINSSKCQPKILWYVVWNLGSWRLRRQWSNYVIFRMPFKYVSWSNAIYTN